MKAHFVILLAMLATLTSQKALAQTIEPVSFCACPRVAPIETVLAIRQAAAICGPDAAIAFRDVAEFAGSLLERQFLTFCLTFSSFETCAVTDTLSERQTYLDALDVIKYLALEREVLRCP